jgi:hypothetical protein
MPMNKNITVTIMYDNIDKGEIAIAELKHMYRKISITGTNGFKENKNCHFSGTNESGKRTTDAYIHNCVKNGNVNATSLYLVVNDAVNNPSPIANTATQKISSGKNNKKTDGRTELPLKMKIT